MSIKRIVFLLSAIAISFAVGISFWTMHTDVVLSPTPESAGYGDQEGDDIKTEEAIIDNANQNISGVSSYIENYTDVSE